MWFGLGVDPLDFVTTLVQSPRYEAIRIFGGWIGGGYGLLRITAPFFQAWLENRRHARSQPPQEPGLISFRTLYVEEAAKTLHLNDRIDELQRRVSGLENENAHLRGRIEGLRSRSDRDHATGLPANAPTNNDEVSGE